MNNTVFAIKVPFENRLLYVQDCKFTNRGQYDTMMFETREAANNAAKAWKKYEVVELVYNTDREEYEEAI